MWLLSKLKKDDKDKWLRLMDCKKEEFSYEMISDILRDPKYFQFWRLWYNLLLIVVIIPILGMGFMIICYFLFGHIEAR